MPVEDIDLWLRMLHKGSKFAILHEVLTSYRSHEVGISKVYNDRRQDIMNRLISSELSKLGIIPSPEELALHRTNFGYGGKEVATFLEKREGWLKDLIEKNAKREVCPREIFREVVAEKWFDSCRSNASLGLQTWKIFWKSDLSKSLPKNKNGKEIVKFFLKAFLRKR